MGKSLSPRLPTKLVTDYGAAARRLWNSPDTVRISHPVIWWTSLKYLSDKRFGRDSSLKQSVTFWLQKPTPFPSVLRYMTWCYGGKNVRMSLVTVEVWCVPCAMCHIYKSMSEYTSRHQTVYLTYWIPLCLPYVISIQEYTRPVDMNIHLEASSYPLFIMIASDTANHSLKFHQLFLYNMQMKQGSVGLYCFVWNWILPI
jgi:hypothetical protein